MSDKHLSTKPTDRNTVGSTGASAGASQDVSGSSSTGSGSVPPRRGWKNRAPSQAAATPVTTGAVTGSTGASAGASQDVSGSSSSDSGAYPSTHTSSIAVATAACNPFDELTEAILPHKRSLDHLRRIQHDAANMFKWGDTRYSEGETFDLLNISDSVKSINRQNKKKDFYHNLLRRNTDADGHATNSRAVDSENRCRMFAILKVAKSRGYELSRGSELMLNFHGARSMSNYALSPQIIESWETLNAALQRCVAIGTKDGCHGDRGNTVFRDACSVSIEVMHLVERKHLRGDVWFTTRVEESVFPITISLSLHDILEQQEAKRQAELDVQRQKEEAEQRREEAEQRRKEEHIASLRREYESRLEKLAENARDDRALANGIEDWDPEFEVNDEDRAEARRRHLLALRMCVEESFIGIFREVSKE